MRQTAGCVHANNVQQADPQSVPRWAGLAIQVLWCTQGTWHMVWVRRVAVFRAVSRPKFKFFQQTTMQVT